LVDIFIGMGVTKKKMFFGRQLFFTYSICLGSYSKVLDLK